MKRLCTICACNNYISKIGKLGENLHGITALVLTNNKIQDLAEIDNIATLTKLEHLSLLDNPVMIKPNYRSYVIHKIPSLKSLDFQKIEKREREVVARYFESAGGRAMVTAMKSTNVLQHEDMESSSSSGDSQDAEIEANRKENDAQKAPLQLTEEQKNLVREAIQNAKSKAEIDTIEKHLKVTSIILFLIQFSPFIYQMFIYVLYDRVGPFFPVMSFMHNLHEL